MFVSIEAVPQQAGWRHWYAVVGALAFGILTGIVVSGAMRSESPPRPVTRLSLTLPHGSTPEIL